MNLKEFIGLQDRCPICDTALITRFISSRQQRTKFIENRFVAIHTLKAINKDNIPDYQVGYSFSLDDDSFCVEFYTEWDTANSIPTHLIDKFKEFYKNTNGPNYRFARHCLFCHKYIAYSTAIDFNLKTCRTGEMQKEMESFIFILPGEERFRAIKLTNKFLPDSTSELKCWQVDREGYAKVDQAVPHNHTVVSGLSHIPFVSKEKTRDRLNGLITFA
jgi:hypothetical protein